MPGPVAQYSFKYFMKGTQKDDTEEYDRVKQSMEKVFSSLQKYQSDHLEGVRHLLASSFAHQKTNIVGAPMASYLNHNKSRFLMSHTTVWCPLKDLKQLLQGGQSSASIHHNGGQPFYQCIALHYLCHPIILEDFSPFHFYS